MNVPDPEEQRATQRDFWEQAALGWARHADRVREFGLPVAAAMVDALALQPGQTVLELAAGPGDTGFLAAELVQPGGKLISTDVAEAMVDLARRRADQAGVRNVEFRQIELEWIDLETATVDAVLCRWGIMLIVDPEAAAREIRRVLRPGGRASLAVWDTPDENPWATIPTRVLLDRGHIEPPSPEAPGMFALAGPGKLQDLLENAGFTDVVVQPRTVVREYDSPEEFVEEHFDLSRVHREVYNRLPVAEQEAVEADIIAQLRPYTSEGGSVIVPGSSLVSVATA